MSWDWHQSACPCPACGAGTWARSDRDDVNLLESQDECRNCRLWSYEFAYGGHQERIGFACFTWSYSNADSHEPLRAAARHELREMYRHPEYAIVAAAMAMYQWALADWLGDHGFLIQETALREFLAIVAEVTQCVAQVGDLA